MIEQGEKLNDVVDYSKYDVLFQKQGEGTSMVNNFNENEDDKKNKKEEIEEKNNEENFEEDNKTQQDRLDYDQEQTGKELKEGTDEKEQTNNPKKKNYYEDLNDLNVHKQDKHQKDNSSSVVKMNVRKIKKENEPIKRHMDLEEKMDLALKVKKYRAAKLGEDDIEKMQDERLDQLKDEMINCANIDIEKNSRGEIATEKLKLLNKVKTFLSRADLTNSILDNNLLEAVRLWLEPLPDASLPAYQIQKELIGCLHNIPIKSDHLVSSGLGLIMKFYQSSKRTEPNLKKSIDKLVNNWTKLILNKSDSYKDKKFYFQDYNKNDYSKLLPVDSSNKQESKSLYEESADRRKRAAIPTAKIRTYNIAPKTSANLILNQQNKNNDERFKKLNQKLALMLTKKMK